MGREYAAIKRSAQELNRKLGAVGEGDLIEGMRELRERLGEKAFSSYRSNPRLLLEHIGVLQREKKRAKERKVAERLLGMRLTLKKPVTAVKFPGKRGAGYFIIPQKRPRARA